MRPTQVITTTASTHLYNSPKSSASSMEALHAHNTLSYLGDAGDYYQVHNTYANQIGYVPKSAARLSQVASLFVPDVFWKDAGGSGDVRWDKLYNDARYFGGILKATQGTALPAAEVDWFSYHWDLLQRIGGADYGASWFRGCYHFLDLSRGHADGTAQAEFFIATVQAAGGLGNGDLPPTVDVELGGDNHGAPVDDVVQTASDWAETVHKALGRKPMLYRSDTSSGPDTQSHMGCSYLWAKRYSSKLNDGRYNVQNVGWDAATMWQYTDGNYSGVPAGYPIRAPGTGKNDHNVFMYNGESSFASVQAFIADSAQS